MSEKLLLWNIYEIANDNQSLNGVMLRGRIRKLGIENGFNVLAENTTDAENGVRFAVLDDADAETVSDYVGSIIGECIIKLVSKSVPNPVLSKMQVNISERYTL